MKIRVKYNSFIPVLCKVDAVTIYPFIFFKAKRADLVLFKHELIHVEQMKKCGVAKWYIKYAADFAKNMKFYRNWMKAYCKIPFEVEAYERQKEPLTELEKALLESIVK